MMSPYIIEIRLVGRIKYDIVNLVKCINTRFDINMHKIVPHVTVVGPFQTTDEKKLVKDFETVCKKTSMINCKINGIDLFSKSGVIYLDVAPRDELEKFRLSLCSKMRQYCRLSYRDFQTPFKFHATVATRLDSYVLPTVLKYIISCKPLIYDVPLLRVTLLKQGRMLSEFDFRLGRTLKRLERANFIQNRESIMGYYDLINKDKEAKPRIFFASDLRLGDRYIIDKCDRPFSTLDIMNNTLVSNWNAEITDKDTVYYLGDLCYKHATEDYVKYWLSNLNGNIIFIKGNEDRTETLKEKANIEYEITAKGKKFFLIHDPNNIPDDVIEDETMWTIHGHTQNRQLDNYPFINREKRTINVSTDLTNYRPIVLEEILDAIAAPPKDGEYELMVLRDDRRQLFQVQKADDTITAG